MSGMIRKLSAALLTIGLLCALSTGSAQAALSVTTEKATAISGTTAELNGTISTDGNKTKYGFAYGKSPSIAEMEGETPIRATTAVHSAKGITERITGLEVGSTYYFVFGAYDTVADEYAFGEVHSFKTLSTDSGLGFMATEYPANITGSLNDARVFTAGKGSSTFTVDCSTRTLSGSLSESSAALSVLPNLQSCSGSFGAVTVSMNSCQILLSIDSFTSAAIGDPTVSCTEEGDGIEFESSSGCTLTVPAQAPGYSFAGYVNNGPVDERSLGAAWGAGEIDWTSNNAFACQFTGLGASGEDGTLTHETTFEATNSEGDYNELFVGGE